MAGRLHSALGSQCEGPARERLEIFAPVDNAGRFTDAVPEFAGQHVFKANPKIIETTKRTGRLLGPRHVNHSYPHCWRCKNPSSFARRNSGSSRWRPTACGERRLEKSTRSVDSGLGTGSHPRHDRQSAGLVSVPSARLGRSDPGLHLHVPAAPSWRSQR